MSGDPISVLHRPAFDDFAGLFDDDELSEMIEQWHADSLAALSTIADALAQDDRAKIGELAHRAAGGALALGATAMARACEGLRAAAESGGAVTAADVGQVRATVTATHAAMRAALESAGEPS
jgi:HPt (histidine-containing phosphotransfer) domain-containing protein